MAERAGPTVRSAPLGQTLGWLEAAAVDPEVARASCGDLQELLAAATRAYAATRSIMALPVFASGSETQVPTATDVVVTVSAMLQSADIELFEVGLWQTIGGARTA